MIYTYVITESIMYDMVCVLYSAQSKSSFVFFPIAR